MSKSLTLTHHGPDSHCLAGAAYYKQNFEPHLDLCDPCLPTRIAEQATHVTKLVQLLGVIPVLYRRPIFYFEVVPAALVALEALNRHRDRWGAELQR